MIRLGNNVVFFSVSIISFDVFAHDRHMVLSAYAHSYIHGVAQRVSQIFSHDTKIIHKFICEKNIDPSY